MSDEGRFVSESDMDDYPGRTVECDWGYKGCTGADYVTEMCRQDGGFMCPSCHVTALAEWKESH